MDTELLGGKTITKKSKHKCGLDGNGLGGNGLS